MSDGDVMTVLSFGLTGRLSAFPIANVQEVLQMVELTSMPDAPDYVAGAMNLRGTVLPIVDMAKLIGAVPAPYTLDTPIIVVHRDDERLGLIVDYVNDVVDLETADVDAPSDLFPAKRLLSGVARTGEGLMAIFDLDRVFDLASGLPALVEGASGV